METQPDAVLNGRDRYLILLGLIAATFLLLMLVDFRTLDTAASDMLFILVTILSAGMLVAALWTSAASRRLIRLGVIFGFLMILGAIGTVIVGSASSNPPVIWVLLMVAAPVVVIRRVASHDQVRNDTIIGAVCAYLLIGLAFSYVYVWVDVLGGPFFGTAQPSTAFPYFSLVTITTLGYGDLYRQPNQEEP